MKRDWCVFDKFFSKEACEEIIEDCKKLPMEYGVIKHNGEFIRSTSRVSKIAFLNKGTPEFNKLVSTIWEVSTIANNDLYYFHLSSLDFMQFAEYDSEVEGEYKKHQDVIWVNDSDRHRKLSIVVQLSDPSTYEGGDFEIYETEYEIPKENFRNQGSVIVFPSFKYHAALPVTKGIRYSLTAWVEGPKWH